MPACRQKGRYRAIGRISQPRNRMLDAKAPSMLLDHLYGMNTDNLP